MTRFGRWTFSGAVAISSLLLVGTMILWGRSRFVQYSVFCHRADASNGALMERKLFLYFDPSGPLLASVVLDVPGFGSDEDVQSWRAARASAGLKDFEIQSSPVGAYRAGQPDLLPLHLGFGLLNRTLTANPGSPLAVSGRSTEVSIPYWLIALLAAIMPVVWWRSPARKYRWKKGHCQQCGYDLRGTPERCPECGGVPKHAAQIQK